ncbi:MAG: tandem-95 repeat protein [Planctomycetota bacterium]
MHQPFQRWLQSVKLSLQGRFAKSTRRAKQPRRILRPAFSTLESLEDRTLLAATAAIVGNVVYLSTDANDNLQVSTSGGNVTFSSTSGLVNGNAAVGGVSSATFSLNAFDGIQISSGGGPTIFSYVEIQGSAAFANESLSVAGGTVDFTTGPLSVSGLYVRGQGVGSTVNIDQTINSTGNVTLETLGSDIAVNAPINAAGQQVELHAGIFAGQNWSNYQSAAGVITASSVYAQASLGTDLSAAANNVSNISGQSLTSGNFRFRSALNLNVTAVGSGVGVSTAAGNVQLETAAGMSITISEAVTAGGSGRTLTLAADAFDLDATKPLTAENVVLTTVGSGTNLTLGGAGLTNTELNSIDATNLRFQASGAITVSGAMTLGDDASQLIALQAGAINVANSLSGNAATGTLRFETNSLALNGAISKSVSAAAVEIVATQPISFSSTFNFGGLDFSANELAALDETTVNTLRFITTGDIQFSNGAVNFNNGFTLASGGVVALKSGATVSQVPGASVTSANLAVVGGAVDLTDAGNSIATLSGSASTGNFLLRSSTNLSIDAVDVGGRGVGASGIAVAAAGNRAELQAANVTQTANGKITAPALGVVATGPIGLTAVDNNVSTLALTTNSGNLSFKNNSGGLLTIGTVGTLAGITSDNASSQVSIVSNNNLAVDASIQMGAGGSLASVSLTSTTGSITQSSGVLVAAETLGLTAGDSVDVAGRLNVGLGDATISAGQEVSLSGQLGLTITSASSYSNVNITAPTTDLTGADLDLTSAYVPSPSEIFTIVTAASLTGAFDGYANDSTFTLNGKTVRVNYTGTDVKLTTLGVAPVLSGVPSAATIDEQVAYTFTAQATDVDLPSQTLTFSLNGAPAGASIDGSTGVFTWTPTEAQGPDSYTFDVVVSDGLLTSTQSITLTVSEVNVAPVLSGVPASATIDEEVAYSFTASATDADLPGQTLTFSLTGAPLGAAIDGSTGVFTWTPTEAQGPGSYTFDVVVSDGTLTSTQSITLTVNEVNMVPVAVNDSYNVDEDGILQGSSVLGNDIDVDGNTLTVSLINGPTNGILALNPNGTFTYTPTANFWGTDTFTYQANDGALDSNVATVTITVNSVNDAPVAVNDNYSVNEDEVLQGHIVLANDTDVDGDTLTASLVVGPTNGMVVLNPDGSFTYTPNANFWGTDSFTYQANDGDLNSNVATVTITVNSVEEFFVQLSPGVTSSPNGRKVLVDPAATLIGATDEEMSGATLTISIVSGALPRDVLRLVSQGRKVGQVNASQGRLRVGRTVVGSVSGGTNGDPLQIQFNTGVTAAVVQKVMRQIGFKGKKQQCGVRTIEFRLTNGDSTGVDTKDVRI